VSTSSSTPVAAKVFQASVNVAPATSPPVHQSSPLSGGAQATSPVELGSAEVDVQRLVRQVQGVVFPFP
jgi:hypothetical protein